MSELHKLTAQYAELLSRPEVREAEFNALFDTALAGVAFVAPDGTFMRVNDQFSLMLGYSRKELEGRRNWRDVTHPEDVDAYAEEADALAKGERLEYRIEKRYLHKRGHVVYVQVEVRRVEGKAREFLHFCKQASVIPISDKNMTVTRDANGNPVIQPIVPIGEFVLRNWKWITAVGVPSVLTFFGGLATFVSGYYEIKAERNTQAQEIRAQAQEIQRLNGRLDARHEK